MRIQWGSAAIVAFAFAGLPFAQVLVPGYAAVGFALMVLNFTLLVGIAVLLTAFARQRYRASLVLLAATYLGTVPAALALALAIPMGPDDPPALPATAGAGPYLYLLLHLVFPIALLAYSKLRGADQRRRSLAPGQARLVMAGAFVAGIGVVIVFDLLSHALPSLVVGARLSAYRTTGVGPLILLLTVFAWTSMLRVQRRSVLDGTISLALLANGLELAVTFVGDYRFSVAWYVARALTSVGAGAVLGGAIRAVMLQRERAVRLPLLRDDELRRAERDAARLEGIWKIAAAPAAEDSTYMAALLGEGARSLRPPHPFHGVLAHLEDGAITVDVGLTDALGATLSESGARIPLNDSFVAMAVRRGRTASWPDFALDPEAAQIVVRRNIPFRSCIATPFRVGAVPYVLALFSIEPLATPFTPNDEAYLETMASLCAGRLEQQVQTHRIHHQTQHDALTDLLNRASFRAAGFAATREHAAVAVIVGDVDNFRFVNDTLGHQTGDALLVEVAATLSATARREEIVARLGGDSFGILIPGPSSREVVERRLAAFARAFAHGLGTGDRDGVQRVPVTLSFGVALAPDDGTDFEKLLARADTALFGAKDAGRARWQFFERSAEAAFGETQRLKDELIRALAADEFELYFQPHIEFTTGRVAGAEALIRWNHPTRGLVPPLDFIPFAEQHGLAGAIGTWVMREAVARSRVWRDEDPNFRVWFNVSPSELSDPAFVDRLRDAAGSRVRGIGAEITESLAMRDVHETSRALGALRAAGFMIALDDFGTGYSSLAQLKRLPIDVVKIDRSFTAGIPLDGHDNAIVEAVLSIADRYGFETVAEGVETMSQVAFLTAAGCTYGQGWAYAPAMPEAAFEQWLRSRRRVSA